MRAPSAAQVAVVAMLPPLTMNLAVGLQPVFSDGSRLPPAQAGALVGLYALGLGLGQFLAGNAADHWGRRPTLLAGLALATVATLLGTLADAAPLLLASRLLAGLGLATALVVPRACLRDVHAGQSLQRAMAVLSMVFALAPAITPPLAWAATELWSWRAALGLGAALVTIALVASWHGFPETRPPGTRPPSLAAWAALQRHAGVRRTVLAFACAAAPFFVIAALGPAALQSSVGFSPGAAALLLGGTYLGFAMGSQWVRHRAATPGAHHVALGIGLVAAGALLLAATLAWPATALWILGLTLYAIGHGVVFPASFSLVLQDVPHQAGIAAAAIGTVHMVAGACSAWIAGALPLAPHPMLVLAVGATAGASALAWWRMPRPAVAPAR
ncbi:MULTISPECIES: MFS transporter [Ramlibacter]|uniref:MFS transporter n=1 Tax=Ramlibacter pinisoli TaxID=2682844 RepID=A0A6N8IRA6_9BURK|nr:MFS transporter [Ramlibacter sp. CGMCC 1.13660]MVQ28646.1 MFS transporter [Ramlibacter pinisoli]